MSANAHHNSGGRSCVDTPAFALIDLVIATAAAGAGAAEDSTGAYVTAGVFGLSGVIGGISAVACGEENESNYAESGAPPASNTAPSFGEAPVDPDARMATPEEMGIAPPAPIEPAVAPPPATPSTMKFRLGEGYDIDKHKPKVEKRSCRDNPDSCPPGETCAIAGDEAGYCVVNDSR